MTFVFCILAKMRSNKTDVYSVTPKPGRRVFVNVKKTSKKYQFLRFRFIKVFHPPRYSKI